MRRSTVLLGMAALTLAILLAGAQPQSTQAAGCTFILGFKTIHDLIPDKVGDCKTDEYHNPQNGDGLQETTAWHGKGGLLVWRKADNWTAYTDGSRTWVNGPNGLQERSNDQRFPWEAAPPPAPTAAPAPPPGFVGFESVSIRPRTRTLVPMTKRPTNTNYELVITVSPPQDLGRYPIEIRFAYHDNYLGRWVWVLADNRAAEIMNESPWTITGRSGTQTTGLQFFNTSQSVTRNVRIDIYKANER
jgi:hypothetical protein